MQQLIVVGNQNKNIGVNDMFKDEMEKFGLTHDPVTGEFKFPGEKIGGNMQFDLTDDEVMKKADWLLAHNPKCRFYDDGTQVSNPMGAIGGRLTYQFTPTGLGVIIVVKCACGESVDLTDYGSW